MKRQLTSIILAGTLSAFAGAVATNAQNARETANVTFDYQVAGKALDAGKVTVKEINNMGLFSVMDSTGKSVYWNATKQVSADPSNPHLTFSCYNGECLLSEVAMPGSNVAHKLSDRQASHNIGIATMISVPLR